MTKFGSIQTLLWKNYLIVKANLTKYLLIYLSPLLILLMLMILQAWAESNFIWSNPQPTPFELERVPRCFGKDCVTLGVVYNGPREPYMQTVINFIKRENKFREQDVLQMPVPADKIMQYLRQHPNKTQTVLVFCSNSSIKVGDYDIPCFAEDYHLNFYTLIYNLSLYHRVTYMGNLKESYPKDYVTVKLKYDIDRGIIYHYNPNGVVNLTFSDFPSQTSRFVKGVSVVAQYGSFFLMLPYLALLVMEGGRLLVQKQKRLRIGLNIIGVTHFQFYFAQIITYFFHVVAISISFSLFGFFLNFKFWINSLIWFDFYILVTNGFILGLLAQCITAAVVERGLGMSILYGFVLYSVVMQWLFTGGFLFDLLYFTNASNVVVFLRYLFNVYPSFHFSKLFSDISRLADSHFDTFQNRFVQGSSFTYKDIFIHQSKTYRKPFEQTYILPSPFQSALYLTMTSFSFLIILWLLDRLVESNRGYSQSLLPMQRKRKNSGYIEKQEKDVLVSITNLQKIYDNKVYALTGVTAQLSKGEIVALLGENGAGKSTLINILIGALAKTRGQARIGGVQVEQDITAIRKLIGVCPQFDILWEQLTAEEHMQLFHRLKGLSFDRQEILRKLASVSLDRNATGRVSTFSGGMRRRLSLALSLVGEPKLVILDQPTTGMDAKVRLQTWKLILALRQTHTVLITTHNMEQAECVADRIMIMSKGRVIAEGTAQQLKRQYGQGYVIRGFNREKSEEVVLRCKEDELERVLGSLEGGNIQNWSLHETTLEEVFLNVSHRF